jgi:ubiquinone/menaquinone biosynthesis C-methylase UbiE
MNSTREKGYRGVGMEGRIATWYAKNTRKDMGEFRALADRFAKELPRGSRILEVAPGPGYLAIELAKRGHFGIKGLDVSKTFVRIAAENARQEAVTVDFQHGNASAMPFAEGVFDLILCRAAFKNFSQPLDAMNEMHRVLKSGGRAVIMDLRKDVSMKDINAYIQRADLGWITSLLYKVTFRYLLIPRAYSREQFTRMASQSDFGGSGIQAADLGFEITLTKQ